MQHLVLCALSIFVPMSSLGVSILTLFSDPKVWLPHIGHSPLPTSLCYIVETSSQHTLPYLSPDLQAWSAGDIRALIGAHAGGAAIGSVIWTRLTHRVRPTHLFFLGSLPQLAIVPIVRFGVDDTRRTELFAAIALHGVGLAAVEARCSRDAIPRVDKMKPH